MTGPDSSDAYEARYTEVDLGALFADTPLPVEVNACWVCGSLVWHTPTHDAWHAAANLDSAPAGVEQ